MKPERNRNELRQQVCIECGKPFATKSPTVLLCDLCLDAATGALDMLASMLGRAADRSHA
ncbi:MAG: hypothetical protein E6Q97_38410 [Desulfurellales bacterium]|nr:MAG: hypothetical protein E6Q97_38410 [Desulfurellales bacterium]